MRLSSVSIAAFIMGILASPLVFSSAYQGNVYWTGGANEGELAASCIADYPLMQPLTIPRTMVVDNSLNIGDIIYSWDYASFMPNYIQVRCIPASESDSPSNSFSGSYVMLRFQVSNDVTDGIMATSLDGVGIRIFYKMDTTTDGTNGTLSLIDAMNGVFTNRPVPEQSILKSTSPINQLEVLCDSAFSPSRNKYIFGCNYNISFRAELVKTGPISVGSLSLPGISEMLLIKWPEGGRDEGESHSFSGDAVTLVTPACQLKNANYTVPMGDFIPLFASRRGMNVPVNLVLECSGKVNNVSFRFEDAGTTPSSGLEKNVSLYSSQGALVQGLEIEMRYEGERVNIDGTAEHSTGSHGQRKTVADSTPLFDSESTASFTANYLQTGPVISGGNAFTGAINGKVNMWVTYN
ncbi:TPA: fimbrial protein [Citrobacter farmeri]|nr:hypothetical protein [Citrobacter farmeri]HCD7631497.1 hypothetical protein [Citrobacter farmeri]